MPLISIEHSRNAHRADILLYGASVLGIGIWLGLRAPVGVGLDIVLWAGAGLLGWSAIEYALHRFVLHGLQPFKRWHLEHHRRPLALIGTPTWLSAVLLGGLVGLPAVLGLGRWLGSALTLGVLVGYLAYTLTHHALHHWKLDLIWLQRRKYAHARHHHLQQPCCFGVTSGFWDRVLRTGGHKAPTRVRVPVRRVG
jgi:sterol desaturase/sphingolipid hydroxylase (fatty acid hydroxylase superfamily)